MSWQPVSLNTPVSDASSLGQSVAVELISPWTHGIKEGNGNHTWLAFPNAVTGLIEKLADHNSSALFVLALTAGSYKDLASQCATMAGAFPLKQLQQWQRHAEKRVVLEAEKLNLVDAVATTNGIKLNSVPTVKARMQKALSQAAAASAGALSNADPLAELASFEADKATFDAGVSAALPNLSGGAGWRFYADSDIANQLLIGHPGYEYTYTAMMAFIGEAADLAFLLEMMPEPV